MGLRAVIIRCPNCNAVLEIASTVTSVKCAYCEVVSRIQPKTMMFQVPPSLPTQPALRQQQLQHLQHLQPVRHGVSPRHIVLPFLVAGMAMAGVYFAQRVSRATYQSRTASAPVVAAAPAARPNPMTWASRQPLLFDVDGDGTADFIGVARYVLDGERVTLAAFSGVNGARLWESDTIGTSDVINQSRLAIMGALVLIVSDRGVVAARDARNGAPMWETAFGEKIDALCAAGDDAAVVLTADEKWHRIDIAGARSTAKKLARLDRSYSDGNARALFDRADAGDSGVCVPLDAAWHGPSRVLALQRWRALAQIKGMDVDWLVRRPDDRATIAIGGKSVGTAVPMLARVEGRKATWTMELPVADPLGARFDAKDIALSKTAVFAMYTTAQPAGLHLTAIDLATGERLWDRQIGGGIGVVPSGLVVSGDTLTLATWQTLSAYSVTDGSDRFRIGQP